MNIVSNIPTVTYNSDVKTVIIFSVQTETIKDNIGHKEYCPARQYLRQYPYYVGVYWLLSEGDDCLALDNSLCLSREGINL